MENEHGSVNLLVEPQMFPGGAIAMTLEALCDPLDGTVLFVVKAQDVSAGKLVALWSSSPLPFEDHDRGRQRALREFTTLLHEHTGPF